MSTTAPTSTDSFWHSEAAIARRKKRHGADRRLQIFGITAITIAIGLLGILIVSLVSTGYQAFVQTEIALPVNVSSEEVSRDDPSKGDYRDLIRQALHAEFPDVGDSEFRQLEQMLTRNAQFIVRDRVVSNPSLVGQTTTFHIPMADPIDQLNKGVISAETPEDRRRVSNVQVELFDQMEQRGLVSTPFNWGLFFNADSRFPELAGLAGAIVGSFYALLVCFLISFPVGIAAAVYLEEFAPKNRLTDIIEVNINNLAAVPSVVFGLLGLAVFLNFFGLPRSAPLVGGMVLSLMTLPTMIIVTRASLKAVPPSIREGALGMGASKHQVITQHVLPLALPGILTGTILGLAQALGETAPLLLIGMNAFITSPPGGIMEPATALPTQIFIWADSPERGFVARTSAAILVLLGFLITMNMIAIFLRSRLERRW
ncbi:phosphate ABC transporter permease PstA [Amorphus coralli]|uniref:phosphate ABC transporter permease PstA n=1 Tax=Amorphus coralli TaxID=340680 RepID=UPI00036C7806|nr:phosphate ABC transporter permease PstA [Amorphus coralli]